MKKLKVAIMMGSQSDWPVMEYATHVLDQLDISYHCMVVSAHRTPSRLYEFAQTAEDHYNVIIAGAGGAAHLPGMTAALTWLPVIGVPVSSKNLQGLDSLLSIVQMPKGVAVATQSIGESGAFNAGLMAAQMLSLVDEGVREKLKLWRENQTAQVSWEVK
ncbi:MAG: 5-(carboxyamino)imidazole ribonucleotide mutase [Phenylobacterium sp.]|jgi:5-(carboxyamino)imidazole ribonucleotide mutase